MERILQTTIAALSRLDPAVLTIQQICRDAGVTAPTIYYHFGSKDGLLAAAIERLVEEWLAVMEASVPRRGDLEETLALAAAAWQAGICLPSRPLAVFVFVTLLSAETSQQARHALQRARDRSEQLVRDAVVPYLGDTERATQLAMVTIDAVIACAVQHRLDDDAAAVRRRIAALVAVIRATVAPAGH